MDKRIGRDGDGRWARSVRHTPLPAEAEKVRRWIKRTIQKKQITHDDLSQAAGISLTQLSRITAGCSETKISTLVRIVEALGYRMVFIPEDKIREARERQQ